MDHVRRPSPADIAVLERLPYDEQSFKEIYGISDFVAGLSGMALKRRYFLEPTCTICGLTAGYQGEGAKTVLPARASAKVDFRLVPEQRPDDVVRQLRAHLDGHGFEDVNVTLLGAEAPARTPPDDPFLQLVAETARPV